LKVLQTRRYARLSRIVDRLLAIVDRLSRGAPHCFTFYSSFVYTSVVANPQEPSIHPFERELSVAVEEIELLLRGHGPAPWAHFYLNPRRLRGSDFLMRWSQGVWSEERLIEAVNETGKFFCCAYGPSGTAPDDDVQAYELYFERLEAAGLGNLKGPDLLVFAGEVQKAVEGIIDSLGGIPELPFTREDDPRMQKLLALAIVAVECENSLWRAQQMPGYGVAMTAQKWLNGQLGMKKTAVLPTVIIKDEDLSRLQDWEKQSGLPIHIWHSFYDMAFGITLAKASALISRGQIAASEQEFQAPGGATSRKSIYKIYYHHAYPLGIAVQEPSLKARAITDKNGHILPFVAFEGGKLDISAEALAVLEGCRR